VNLHSKGVYSFDWCHAHSMMISGGVERDIMLWHGSTGHKIGSLVGHASSISNVCVDNNLHEVISLSTDKTIKIWDLRTNRQGPP
jgi:WD40 repeat protein